MNESWKDFLKYCIHEDVAQPASASDIDWKVLAEFMRKQALIGVMMRGMNKLKGVKIPREVIMHTFALSEQVKKNNQMLNKRSVEVAEQYRKAGYKCCILKGQGNAVMYPDVYMRQPGDVDVWVCGAREEIISYVKKHHPEAEIRFFHAEYHENGVPVEAHYMPAIMNNPKFNRRLQQFFSEAQEKQCDHWVELTDGVGKIPAPTVEFNIVFQLCHMMHHFYVLIDVFGLDKSSIVAPIDERRGRTLMYEIMRGGNFGQYSGLSEHGTVAKYLLKNWRSLQLIREYPAEALAEPLFRTYHFFWRRGNK